MQKVLSGTLRAPSGRISGGKSSRAFPSRATSLVPIRAVALDGVEVADVEGSRSLVAAKDFAIGETVLSVPQPEFLSPQVVDESKYGKALEGQDPWVKLCVFLVGESANASSSKFQDYLATLPQSMADLRSPVFWPEDELALLTGTQLLEKAIGYRRFLANKFGELEASVFSKDRALFPQATFTAERFVWAFGCVRMRTHEPLTGERIALVPFADLVAHRRSANVAWKASAKQGGLFGMGGGGGLTLEATKAVRAGEVLCMDFGAGKLDSQIALDYGVVDVYDRRGGVSLSVGVDETDRNFDDKADILESIAGLQTMNNFDLVPGKDVPEEFTAILRLQSLSGADAFLLEALFRNEAWNHMLLPVSEENERAVCEGMVAAARSALSAYPGSVADDVALLRSLKPGSREELAVVVRLGEKEALEDTIRYFETRLGQLKTLEYYQERRLKRLGLMDERGKSTWDGFFKDSIA